MRLGTFWQSALQVILIGLLLFALVIVIQALTETGPSPEAQGAVLTSTFTPLPAKIGTPAERLGTPTAETPTARPKTPAPYPPPPSPTVVQAASATRPVNPGATPTIPFPDTPPLLDGLSAVVVHDGELWRLNRQTPPKKLTDLQDVSVLFSTSPDGGQLLFGRGRFPTGEYSGDTTALWLIELATLDVRPFLPGELVQLAAWSPDADRVAVCEFPNRLKIVALDGQTLHEFSNAICGFAWSPDGEAIAVPTFTPEMVDPLDGLLYTIMAIWWPGDGRVELVSEESGEVHGRPIWSLDGTRLLFDRSYHAAVDKQPLSGAHVLNLSTGLVTRLESASPGAYGFTRSPRADRVAYILGEDILVMDFDGRSETIAAGRAPTWLPDGQTLLYRAPSGELKTAYTGDEVIDGAAGGFAHSEGFYSNTPYFIVPNEVP